MKRRTLFMAERSPYAANPTLKTESTKEFQKMVLELARGLQKRKVGGFTVVLSPDWEESDDIALTVYNARMPKASSNFSFSRVPMEDGSEQISAVITGKLCGPYSSVAEMQNYLKTNFKGFYI